MPIYRCVITLLEPTFFSSREVSNFYYTEPVLGNYALAYALGFVQAPYFNDGTIHYAEHLGQLNRAGVYVTPATFQDEPRFVIRQFNAQADAHWSAFANNVIVTRPDGTWTRKDGAAWYVIGPGDRRQKVGLENRPQHGTIRFLAIDNRAVAYVISQQSCTIPSYIRLGKFMSKACVETTEVAVEKVTAENVPIRLLLNPGDLPPEYRLTVFDLINVPPTPLANNAQLSGEFYRLAREVFLPVGMRFGVEGLA